MTPSRGSMTRSSSSDSSALSNITVVATGSLNTDSTDAPSASTPPTSVSDTRSMLSATEVGAENGTEGRSKRKRQVSSYNLKELANTQHLALGGKSTSRNASGLTGRTLVASNDEQDESTPAFRGRTASSSQKGWKLSRQASPPARSKRQPTVKDRLKNAGKKVASVLGKRSREAVDVGRKTLGRNEKEDPKQKKLLRELDMGKRGILDEMDLDEEGLAPPPRPVKRAKLEEKVSAKEIAKPLVTGPLQKTSDGKKVKKWQTHGLYVGQEATDEGSQGSRPNKLVKKRPGSSQSQGPPQGPPQEPSQEPSQEASVEAKVEPDELPQTTSAQTAPRPRSFMPLPMFNRLGKTRDFFIPYDVFAPAATRDDKPKDWRQLNRNRLIGEAKDLWEKEERLPASACVCPAPAVGEQGCEEDCLNRVMQYECNEDNCNLSHEQCSNRAFAELAVRTKKGGRFDVGVEVIKTGNRGFGVRACRSFLPGQVIMEYTGEIISEGECQRRMREDYKDKRHYYLMELERNLVIDGTKGSMARFINHSCEPNCEVRMVKVGGIPRMGVFAGTSGIMTGEELTYDYNFDNFGETQQACYCGAPSCRGTLSKRLNAAEQKKQAKEDVERKRKAAAEAQKRAEEEQRKKKIKTDRGSNWRGWVAVDDAEVKEQLKAEKRAKEEAEKSSARSMRAAARLEPPTSRAKKPIVKTASPRRKCAAPEHAAAAAGTSLPETNETSKQPKKTSDLLKPENPPRTTATGSKFKEELNTPPSSKQTVVKKMTVTATTSTVAGEALEATFGAVPTEITLSESVSVTQVMSQSTHAAKVGADEGVIHSSKKPSLLANVGSKLKQTTLKFTKLG